MNKEVKPDTLCWTCKRSTNGTCSWSKKRQHVDGVKRWAFVQREDTRSYGRVAVIKVTNTVLECPKYKSDAGRTMRESKILKDRLRRLAVAVVIQAGRDYRVALETEVKRFRRDPSLFQKRKLYGGRYRTLYGYKMAPADLKQCEKFLREGYAPTDVDGKALIETIKRETGYTRVIERRNKTNGM